MCPADPPPAALQTVTIVSSLDQASEPVWFLPNPLPRPAPLLVHLHSWSSHFNRSAGVAALAQECEQRGWSFLSPNFRGPNDNPLACASPHAIQDVLDAVSYAIRSTIVDHRRIYLLGGSGGGHMALTMAHSAPSMWAAVSAWVPITDLASWHAFSRSKGSRYHRMLEGVCGGVPEDPAADLEYRRRSPLFHLSSAAGLPIDIQAGINDGHGSAQVPVDHSLRAFNELAAANGAKEKALTSAEVEFITREARLPPGLKSDPFDEPSRLHEVLFRRTAGPVRLTLFEGAHETDFSAAMRWLETQRPPPALE